MKCNLWFLRERVYKNIKWLIRSCDIDRRSQYGLESMSLNLYWFPSRQVPSFSQHNLCPVVSGRCLYVSVTKFQDKFASLRQVNSPYSWNKFQICCTDMYLIRFLPNFAVFFVFLWISRDFADLPEFAAPRPREISEALISRSIKWLKCTKKAIKVYIPHEKLCLCCFLTVSCPINAILASFNVLVSQLLRKIQGKTRPYYAARRKSYKNYLHSTPIAPKLRLSTARRFSFLENVSLVPNIESWPQEHEKCR